MRALPDEPNVHLRETGDGAREVVLAFPYDGNLVAAVRTLPGRRFDWDRREWSAPADDWVAVRLGEILRLYPDLTTTSEVDEWLASSELRWVGHVRTARHDGRGWWALDTLAGTPPPALQEGAVEHEGRLLVPLTRGRRGSAPRAPRPAASASARAAASTPSSTARSRPRPG